MHARIDPATAPAFSSASYWEGRYAGGGNSGTGSRGRLLTYKAAFLNGFFAANEVTSVVDIGCGDGELAARLRVDRYLGADVSPTALARCRNRLAGEPSRAFVPSMDLSPDHGAEVALSIDVIFHLIEDAVFNDYTTRLFALAIRYVVIYASNCERPWPSLHVRHRRVDHLAPSGWRLAAHLPNPFAFDPACPDASSFADFFVYVRSGRGCSLVLPETA
jgi:SAM-dependent methyltransferase